ncbi:hypothetical protein D9613_009238 [Agrocybe pediades]|uniref:Uncharacterized protein n=1 Tax=Agrocybe pediades TaxID=84607 RepID=A0A8H4VTX2_9AGAR|nr:hypothetical protein D9613_009238 [Agrocybe pediades]
MLTLRAQGHDSTLTLANTRIPKTSSSQGPAKSFLHDPVPRSSSSSTEDLASLHRETLPPLIPLPPLSSKTTTTQKANHLLTLDSTYKGKGKEKILKEFLQKDYPDRLVFPKPNFLFTPETQSLSNSRSTTPFLVQKSLSSPVLCDPHQIPVSPPPYSRIASPLPERTLPPPPIPIPTHVDTTTFTSMNSDSEDDDRDENDMIYTSSTFRNTSYNAAASGSSSSLRSRIFGLVSSSSSSKVRDKLISTAPGTVGAGETETETDEPSRHLPTARIILSSGPLIPPNTLEARITPLLFEFSRLLSIVPAIFGTMYNLYHIWRPPSPIAGSTRQPPERLDYFVSAIWAILTGYQCLALATGLLTRWRLYYPPLSTLVRLLALQGICWPATHLTLTILEHEKRPVITWAVIGTTTCMSRSVQIWVTSNLWWEKEDGHSHTHVHGRSSLSQSQQAQSGAAADDTSTRVRPQPRTTYWKRWRGGGKWGGRRWDWREVGVKCVLPAGIVYFVMAWAEQLRREFAAC